MENNAASTKLNRFFYFGLFLIFIISQQNLFAQSPSLNSYQILTADQIVNVGTSKLFYVPVSGVPTNAIITNIEVKFDYIAYGSVQSYVSCRFNKGADPGTSGGISLVSQGSLTSGNPGTYSNSNITNWNSQSGINTNYYFRFSLATGQSYTCTIKNIYVNIYYSTPTILPDLVATKAYMASIGTPGTELVNPKVGDIVRFNCAFRLDKSNINNNFKINCYLDNNTSPYYSTTFNEAVNGSPYYLQTDKDWVVQSGSHNIRWVIDADKTIYESDETNNEISKSWIIAQQFDLKTTAASIVDINGSSISGLIGQTVYPKLSYSVIGQGITSSFDIRCTVDNNVLFIKSGISNSGGSDYSITSTTGFFVTSGVHTIKWTLDYNSSLSESDETNNDAVMGWTAQNVPTVPQNVQVVYQKEKNWNLIKYDKSSDAIGYRIYWNTKQGVTKQNSNQYLETSDLSFGHSNVQIGSCYYYRVAAYNNSAESDLSQEVSVCPTNSPTLSLISPSQNQTYTNDTILFRWSSISNATKYELYVDNNSGLGSAEISPTNIAELKNLTNTQFRISANWLTPGGYYYWKVVAITPTGKIESTIGTFTYSPTPNSAPQWVPLYKTFNPDIVDHFYCSSDTHLKEAVTNKYRFEGVEGYVALLPFVVSSPNKLLPIYRFLQTDKVNAKMSCHFYTTDSIDRDNRIIQGWSYEGIVGYGLKLPEEGLTSLYHTYLNVPNARRDNFYTVSEIQKNNSISLFGYLDIGSICYISATGDNSTMPWLSTSPEVGMGANPLNGNLSNYTTNIFTIPEGKVGLNYGHLYNSLAVRFLNNNNPLGNGWSHSYNISLSVNESNVFVFWSDEVNIFNKTSLKSITSGVYDILTQQSSAKYQIKKKDQTVYTFEKLANVTNTDNTYMLTSITDRFGNQISLSYNNQGWLKTVKSPKNRYLSFTYYSQSDTARFGLIHYVKDSLVLNRTVEYIYDSQRNLISFIDAKKQTTAYTYNTDSPFDHFLDAVTYADGTKISNKFDPVSKRLTSQSFISNQATKQTTINNIGPNQYKVTDETGKYTSYTADATGNMTELLTPSGKATYSYTDLSNTTKPTDIMDGKGNHTTVSYNVMGDPLVINKPLNIIHKYQWNTTNDLVKYTNPLNNETNFTYIDGKLTAVTTPRGTTNMTYFTNGNVNTVNDPLSQTITYNYDTLNNVKSVTDILGNSTQYDYDAASRAIKVIDANQKSNYYNYDNNDLLISTVDALNKTTQNTYDAANRLISVRDARQNITSMTFDVNTGLLNQITDQLQKQTNYSYYDNGLLKSTTNRNNQTVNYTYDNDNRLANVNGPSINRGLTYDLNDKVIQITDNNDTLKFEYDELNRLKSQTDFFSNQVKYEYNEVGGVKKITYPIINKSVLYDYYSDNLLKTVTDWDNRITIYTYRNDGSIDKITLPNGTITQYSYDSAGRLTGLQNNKSDGTVINSYTYTLDSVGNHINVTANEPLIAPSLVVANLSYSYDKANRILNAGSTTFTHDGNGNMLSQNDNGTITGFTYDAENKLIGVTGTFAATYGYDAMGYRRSATRNGVTTRYVLDVNARMENVIMETDASNVPLFYYIQGNGLLYRIKTSDNSAQYYHYDSRGSTVAITNQNQSITHKYTYDSFGKVTNSVEADFNPYRFVGKYGVLYDNSDLYFMRARYYKPELGRFISEDPVWGTNLYAYVENNPNMFIDPNGKCPLLLLVPLFEAGYVYLMLHPEVVENTYELFTIFMEYKLDSGLPPSTPTNSVGKINTLVKFSKLVNTYTQKKPVKIETLQEIRSRNEVFSKGGKNEILRQNK